VINDLLIEQEVLQLQDEMMMQFIVQFIDELLLFLENQ